MPVSPYDVKKIIKFEKYINLIDNVLKIKTFEIENGKIDFSHSFSGLINIEIITHLTKVYSDVGWVDILIEMKVDECDYDLWTIKMSAYV